MTHNMVRHDAPMYIVHKSYVLSHFWAYTVVRHDGPQSASQRTGPSQRTMVPSWRKYAHNIQSKYTQWSVMTDHKVRHNGQVRHNGLWFRHDGSMRIISRDHLALVRHDGPYGASWRTSSESCYYAVFGVSSLCLLDVLILCHINRMFLSLLG